MPLALPEEPKKSLQNQSNSLREAIYAVFREDQRGDYGDHSGCISIARLRTHRYLTALTVVASEIEKMKREGLLLEMQIPMDSCYCLTPKGKAEAGIT